MVKLVVLVNLCAFVAFISALRIPLREDFHQEKAYLSIRHHDDNDIRREKREIPLFPEYTQVVIKTPSRDDVTLDLRKTPNINVNMPVYVTRDGNIQKEAINSNQNVAVYKDVGSGASILLEKLQNGTNTSYDDFSVFGSFHTQEGIFVIQPHETEGHILSRVPQQTVSFDMESLTGTKVHVEPSTETETDRKPKRVKRQSISNMVEVFIVTDYELYSFWYAMTSGSNRGSQTMQLIRQYMSYILNEMDMRYESIGRSDYSIGILNSGIYIAQTPIDAPWSENNKFFGSPMYKLSTSPTLDAFRTWVNQQTSFPPNDHVMGFTSYDLVSSSNSGDSSGIAFTGALCSSSSMSLVEDHLTFISMTTATHELGHSLGSVHDGDNGNSCSSADNYIMAVTNRITDDEAIAQNPWKFSSCSKDAFKTYMDGLSVNCMLTKSPSSVPATVDTPMAELYPPDKTCEYALGTGSYVCRSIQTYSTMCTSMYCNEPGTTQCYTILPAEGTPCGQGKWCQDGACVVSASAPSNVDDNCPIGDHPHVLESYGQTCAQLVADNPSRCYSSYVSKMCCQSCANAYTGVTGCEYGDKNVDSCSTLSRFGCYNNEQFCCARCPPLKNTQIPGCEYGDKLSGCQASRCQVYTTATREGCCETCFDGTTVPTTTTTSTTTTTTPTTTTTTPTTISTTRSTTTTPSRTSTTSTTSSSTTTTTTRPSTESTTRPTAGQSSTPTPTSPTMGTNASVTTPTTAEGVSDTVIIGVGVAGGVLILIVVIVIVCFVRKRRAKTSEKSASNGTYDNIGFVGKAPNHPPPRRGDSALRSQPPSNLRSQPPSAPVKPTKPSMPVFPLSNEKSDVDGYMMPASPEVKTVSTGVLYTPLDKSETKAANPILRTFNDDNDTTDPQKRTSKTIHYKRPSGLLEDKPNTPNHYTTNTSDETGNQTVDVYDSIGQVDAMGPTTNGTNGHLPTMYHKPYNVKVTTPSLPERPESNNQTKPVLSSKRQEKPLLPPIRNGNDKPQHGRDNSAFSHEINSLNVEQATSVSKRSPRLPPKPVPRPNRNKPIETNDVKQEAVSAVDVYDTADTVETKRVPLKPPSKPVPRRQPKATVDKRSEHSADNVGFDSDGIEIQI